MQTACMINKVQSIKTKIRVYIISSMNTLIHINKNHQPPGILMMYIYYTVYVYIYIYAYIDVCVCITLTNKLLQFWLISMHLNAKVYSHICIYAFTCVYIYIYILVDIIPYVYTYIVCQYMNPSGSTQLLTITHLKYG